MTNSKTNGSGQGRKTVCVVGSDDHNLGLIRAIPGADAWDIVPVLTWGDMQPPSGRIDFDDLYDRAREIIEDEAGGAPDAVIGYLDFPVTSLVSLLIRDYGLHGATPRAVACCEHKYWMRKEQQKIFPDSTPDFRALNPFNPEEAKKNAPPYPFWLKPVKGHSSMLGFMVEDEEDLEEALHECRQKIHLVGTPFNSFLAQVGEPAPDGVDGNYAVAEGLISAKRQFTLEGYVCKGETKVYGAVESLREGKHNSSFSRYQYPADLPERIVMQGRDIAAEMMAQIGYDNSPFNIEFFWNPETDALHLLEINPRISKSHSPLFQMVDGSAHQKVAIELAMGRKPKMPRRKGKDAMAGKFMLRSYEPDGIVQRVPRKAEIEEMERILPDIDFEILVQKGQRLTELAYQDSYSFELADIFLGGDDEEMLEDAYARCLHSLPIYIQPLPKPT